MTLQQAQELRTAGKHKQAREVLVELARSSPVDAVVQYGMSLMRLMSCWMNGKLARAT